MIANAEDQHNKQAQQKIQYIFIKNKKIVIFLTYSLRHLSYY
jgi:hypothetical protein